MAKVKRSTPVTAPAPSPLDPGATAAKAKKSAPAGAAITAGKSPAAAAPLIVIEIPSSPDRSTGGSHSTKKARKRPAPRLLDLDDEIEMWTPLQKQRLDEDCQILVGDPLSSTTEVAPSPASANDEIAVVAERGKIACRDYPHPRSACAKHPFSRTPHEHYCDKALVCTAVLRGEMEMWNNDGHEWVCTAVLRGEMEMWNNDECFCYVCDTAAPCVFWKGHGGHCHASDRDKKWKSMRFSMQKSTKAKPS